MITISSRAVNQDLAGAKRAANDGPVFITDRGKPAHVLMTVEEYRRLSGAGTSIVAMLASDDDIELDFDWPRPKSTGLMIPNFDE